MESKKIIKIIALTISSLIIAGVSATSYSYMYLQGTVTVGTRYLQWIKDGTTETDETVSITLNVEQATPTNISERLYLKNTHTTNSYSLTLTVTSAASPTDFDELTVYVYKNGTGSWTQVGTLNALSSSSSLSDKTIDAGEYFRFDFWINATTTNGGSFTITVQYPS